MHYRNGREAKPGDKVVSIDEPTVITGIIHSLNVSSETCNGRIAQTSVSDPYVTIGKCIHIDDIKEAFPEKK